MQDQGGFIFKERFCESDRGRFSKTNEQQWGPRLMQSAWSIGAGLKVQLLSFPKSGGSARTLEVVILFFQAGGL